jgi:hypothetical protein
MNALRRTITVLIAFSLLTPGLTFAQDASEQEAREALLEKLEAAKRGTQEQAEPAHNLGRVSVGTKQTIESNVAPARSKEPVNQLLEILGSQPNHWPHRSGGAASVLVIPSTEIATKDLLKIHEDLNVMSRIFEKNLQEDAHITPAGGRLFLDSSHYALITPLGRGVIQSMYLQGYGAVFLVKVDFPLSAPAQMPQKEEDDGGSEIDKVWEQMKLEMYEPERVAKSKRNRKTREYDPEKVESLKTTLVESLKHAANIRNLKPDEWAILTITGSGESADVQTVVLKGGGKSDSKRRILVHDKNTGITKIVEGNSPRELGLSSPTVLVIRARKADIDSFATGDLDLEQFRQRVQLLSYPYLDGRFLRADMYEDYREFMGL